MREHDYILEIPISYRKDFGQFFTPSSVAHLMAEWVMKDYPKTILDPAFGLGIFYDEIKKIYSSQKLPFYGQVNGLWFILKFLTETKSHFFTEK